MSVQSEITRIETAKAAIGTAIAGKGVAVPSGTKLDGMAALIEGIEQGSDPVLQEKTVTPATSAQSVTPDSGYDGLSKVTVNAMPTATQATPSISVSSAGLITASATQSAGYVAAGTKSATKQLTVQAAQTITPGTSNKTIASGRYLTGMQTIKGDANLVAGNIKSGVSIFGVAGSYEGSGGSVETCTVIISASSGLEWEVLHSSGSTPLIDSSNNPIGTTLTVKKGEVIHIMGGDSDMRYMECDNCELIFSGYSTNAAYYTCSIRIDGNAVIALV